MPSRTAWPCCFARPTLLLTVIAVGAWVTASACAARAAGASRTSSPSAVEGLGPSVRGAWRVAEIASRAPGEGWAARPGPPAGLYVFSARHYSYFYVPGVQPRPRFAEANRPTDVEKAAAYDSFIAGAGPYTFDGRTLELRADLRKNPNEMTGEVWRWQAEARGDTLRLVFVDPPFLPGREWRVTLVRVE